MKKKEGMKGRKSKKGRTEGHLGCERMKEKEGRKGRTKKKDRKKGNQRREGRKKRKERKSTNALPPTSRSFSICQKMGYPVFYVWKEMYEGRKDANDGRKEGRTS